MGCSKAFMAFQPDTFRFFAEKAGFVYESIRILPLDVFYISQLSEKYKGYRVIFKRNIEGIYFCISDRFSEEREAVQ